MSKLYPSVIMYCAIALIFSGCAQSTYQQGNHLYNNLAYSAATERYQAALKKKDIPDAKIRLADSYRLTNQSEMAEKYYREVVEMPTAQPIHRLYFAQMLMRNGKSDEARHWFTQYLEAKPNDRDARTMLASIDSIEVFKSDSLRYAVELSPLNSNSSSFATVFYNNGIVFASDRNASGSKRNAEWTGRPFLDLYYAKHEADDKWGMPVALKGDVNGMYHDGPATFSSDGNTMYFTRNNYLNKRSTPNSDRVINLRIFSAVNNNGEWGNIREFPLNHKEYSVGHPTINSKGDVLYFVSDMPGGYGGTDLWMSRKTGENTWSEPTNMGADINTAYNEAFPYLQNDTVLYFASQGHANMGGLDVFESLYDGQKWSAPQNMKYPINTASDDFAYSVDAKGEMGFLSSNRNGNKDIDQVFAVSKKDIRCLLDGLAIDKKTKLPMGNVTVELVNKSTREKKRFTTNADGKFDFKLEHANDYVVSGSYPQYFTATADVNTNNRRLVETIPVILELDMIVIEKAIVMDNIYYDLDKWDIRSDAAVELNKLVKLLDENPNIVIELSSHTDSRSSDAYNQSLSQKRAESAVKYIVSNGVDKDRISAKGYGESKLVNKCGNGIQCSEEEHQQNRRTEFKVTKIKE